MKGGKNIYNIIRRCVNETDFYTLEPLMEIRLENLLIVKEETATPISTTEAVEDGVVSKTPPTYFYYGFNINSLITLYRKNGSIQNPYNRKDFTIETIQNIFSHYQILCILFKERIAEDNLIDSIVPYRVPSKSQINTLFNTSNSHCAGGSSLQTQSRSNSHSSTARRSTRSLRSRNTTIEPASTTTADTRNTNNVEVASYTHGSIFHNSVSLNTLQAMDTIRTSMNIFKQQPVSVRINELFMYIDQLGNYTDSAWFSQLNKRKYNVFYSQLRELWMFRAQIPVYVKNNICPLGDPFVNSAPTFRKPYDQTTEEEMCEGCLDAMENIIMTSLDVEYRKIGCLHVLTALTYVSLESRVQYGFLIE